jgi:hypothetical protein
MDEVEAALPRDWPRITYNNALMPDLMTYGRFAAVEAARTELVYLQDDDCVQRDAAGLLAMHRPGQITAVWGHGKTPAGYDDVAIFPGGAIVERDLALRSFDEYLHRWPMDRDFFAYCDFIFGCVTPSVQLHMPFEIRDLARNGRRLADQPWARESKCRVTGRARYVRDHVIGPSRTDTMPIV